MENSFWAFFMFPCWAHLSRFERLIRTPLGRVWPDAVQLLCDTWHGVSNLIHHLLLANNKLISYNKHWRNITRRLPNSLSISNPLSLWAFNLCELKPWRRINKTANAQSIVYMLCNNQSKLFQLIRWSIMQNFLTHGPSSNVTCAQRSIFSIF